MMESLLAKMYRFPVGSECTKGYQLSSSKSFVCCRKGSFTSPSLFDGKNSRVKAALPPTRICRPSGRSWLVVYHLGNCKVWVVDSTQSQTWLVEQGLNILQRGSERSLSLKTGSQKLEVRTSYGSSFDQRENFFLR